MNMLSVVAQCTPFSDMNQSPRNMYQCQMGKQTMGSPMFAYSHRCDNKSYRILTPQMPLVRNAAQDTFRMDDYPMGTNAVVAVISYTGYDMEDAMIINKASYDRGFGHGHVYTYTIVDLDKSAPKGSRCLQSPPSAALLLLFPAALLSCPDMCMPHPATWARRACILALLGATP